jgi:hypothetical protein
LKIDPVSLFCVVVVVVVVSGAQQREDNSFHSGNAHQSFLLTQIFSGASSHPVLRSSEWKKASKAFINTVRHGLPANTTGCYRNHWKVMESWVAEKGVKVTVLPPPSRSKGSFIEPFSQRTYRDSTRTYKLIRLRRVHLEGKSMTRLYQAAPRCMVFTGEHTASGVPPWNWGVADELQPPLNPPREIRSLSKGKKDFFEFLFWFFFSANKIDPVLLFVC